MKKSACRFPTALACALTLIAGAAPASLASQSASMPPIFLVLPESFPDVDARFVLLREPGRDLVVLNPSEVTSECLDVALALLRHLGPQQLAPETGRMIPVMGFAGRPPIRAAERDRLDRALTRLRARPLAQTGNLGPGRWMRFAEE